MPSGETPCPPPTGPLTKTGKKKTIWFNLDEAEALRTAAFKQRRTESDIVRTAVREYLGIEP